MKTPCLTVLLLCMAAPALADPGELEVGSTHWIGEHHFQYLGHDEGARELWLYPHFDGVFEVFTVTPAEWSGTLGSVFDPARKRFDPHFNVADVLDELLNEGVERPSKRRAARLLALFERLHPEQDGPFYARSARRALRLHLDDEGRAWVQAAQRSYEQLLDRVDAPGTRILTAPKALHTSEDHYRALVEDGYLDVAVIGGNSEDDEGNYHSTRRGGQLMAELRKQGFAGRTANNQTTCARTIRMFEMPVRVRLRITPAGNGKATTRRSVVAFVEGLAQSDVLIYYGHSNSGSGYYVSESRNATSRFRGRDWSKKTYGMGQKAHQIVALNSCLSYERYCGPIRSLCDENPVAITSPGLIGTNARAPRADFVPRVTKLLELLQEGAGTRKLSQEVNAIRPLPRSPDMLFRGVLQPRNSFVVPTGVTVKDVKEQKPMQAFLVTGAGSDGTVYHSTGIFPQDRLGDVVQVAPYGKGVYGVARDGSLWCVSRFSSGAPEQVVAAPGPGEAGIVFATWAKHPTTNRLYLLDSAGDVRYVARKNEVIALRHDPPPRGVRFVAVGNATDGRFVALDAAGGAYASVQRRWEPLEHAVAIDATPSLLWGDTEVTLGR